MINVINSSAWYTVVMVHIHHNSSSHASTSSIIHESDVDIEVDLQVHTTDAGRSYNYIVPYASLEAPDHEPIGSDHDVSVTFKV